jgi:hypothetical protein
LRYARYGLIGFWVAYAAPWVFIKLGLQDTIDRTKIQSWTKTNA